MPVQTQDAFENELIAETKSRLAKMDDRSLGQFFDACEQLCTAATRRGQQPPDRFVHERRLAQEEIARRSKPSLS
jgi:hypothetical protein